MNAASTQPRSFDVLCAGLAVGNVVVRPVPEHFSGGDTVQVQEISMMGGGDAFNQACVLAALGEKPVLLSRMADDDSGRMMRAALQKRGVDDRFVFSDPDTGTSTCIVLIKENAQRSFLTFKGCLRNLGDGDIDYACVRQARLVSIGGLFSLPSFDRSASIRLLQAAKDVGCITVVDTKYDAFHIGLQGIGNLLEYTDYFFPSYDEASALSGLTEPTQIARFFRSRGAKHVGVKLGADGCYVCSDAFCGTVAPFCTSVLDTTGAGDNFMAGLIHGVLRGWTIQDCVTFANAAGALACSRHGATSDLDYLQPIRNILSQTEAGTRLVREGI